MRQHQHLGRPGFVTHRFDFPADAVRAFTDGDCGYLAFELHRLTGFTPVTASMDYKHQWTHAAVLTPDGRVLDIEGVWDIHDWLDRWLEGHDGFEHFAAEWNSIAFMGTVKKVMPHFPHIDARHWAQQVLDEYQKMV